MIGIFDSGIGGVTVLKSIINLLPNYHYIYYSDSINNPYGDKDNLILKKITNNIVNELTARGCKIIVIACNTASAICKDSLRKKFFVPIIAIEPALKMIRNYDGDTLVMATKGTIESDKFKELLDNNYHKNIKLVSCSGLADLIEQDKKEEIKKYLKDKLSYSNIQNVVLGCTHYPLIKEEIREVLGNVNFYDGALGVAKELERVVNAINLKPQNFQIDFIDSSNDILKEKRFYELLNID